MSKIRLYGDTSGYMDITVPATADNSAMDLSTVVKEDASGNVGIGTDSPTKPLHIYGNTSNNHQIRLQNDFGSGADWTLNAYGANGNLYIGNNLDRVVVDSSGRVTMPYQPSFEVSATGNGSDTDTGIFDKFDTVRHNIGGHFSTSTHTFTAPIAGRYLFTFQVFTNGGQEGRMDLRVNGVNRYRATRQYTSTSFMTLNCAIIVNLNVNDYVDMYLSTGEVHYNSSYSQFCGHLLG